MNDKVYIETSVISYYTSRPSRDIVSAAMQAITQEWWKHAQEQFDLYISVLVVEEAAAGDPEAAMRRLEVIKDFAVLDLNNEVERIAKSLLDGGHIPTKNSEDAVHIVLATVHGMDYLVTWNFRHINNATMRSRIRVEIEKFGYECPVICSPEELGGGTDET